jgi:hypothetical protein
VKFLARATPLAKSSTPAISKSNSSSVVLLTAFAPSFGRHSSILQPPLYNIGECSQLPLSPEKT